MFRGSRKRRLPMCRVHKEIRQFQFLCEGDKRGVGHSFDSRWIELGKHFSVGWQCRKAGHYWIGHCIKLPQKCLIKRKWTAYGLRLRLHENTQGRKEQREVFPMYMEEVRCFSKFFYHCQHFGWKYAVGKRLAPVCSERIFPENNPVCF